ncbi:MAG: putative sugar nucleotidyl transferase [Planctomycetaceae bacterium]
MQVAFFEDDSAGNFSPIALLRPVFELVCGRFSLRERVIRRLNVTAWGAFVRMPLVEVCREEHPEAQFNGADWLANGPTLAINGRWLPTAEALDDARPDDAGVIGDELAYVTIRPEEAALLDESNWGASIGRLAQSRRIVGAAGRMTHYPWDLVDHNAEQLTADFPMRDAQRTAIPANEQVAVLGPADDVCVHPQAQIDPFVVLDARNGPISIDAGAVLQSFTRIEGPCHVGRGAQLFRANVRGGTTIGPVCRVGGEVEASILHGYANKYHDGFLGHSYVCPWVNLGAQTTNSDLKNDYSAVRVPVEGVAVDTGSNKVGCFIGDHTKTALGSLFNTGSAIGVMCMVLPAGELLPKHVPSFSRIWHGVPDDGFDLNSGLQTARTAMDRRNVELTEAHQHLLRHVYEETQPERDAAIERFRKKLASRRVAESPPLVTP